MTSRHCRGAWCRQPPSAEAAGLDTTGSSAEAAVGATWLGRRRTRSLRFDDLRRGPCQPSYRAKASVGGTGETQSAGQGGVLVVYRGRLEPAEAGGPASLRRTVA